MLLIEVASVATGVPIIIAEKNKLYMKHGEYWQVQSGLNLRRRMGAIKIVILESLCDTMKPVYVTRQLK